jgi:hypothetical protein
MINCPSPAHRRGGKAPEDRIDAIGSISIFVLRVRVKFIELVFVLPVKERHGPSHSEETTNSI